MDETTREPDTLPLIPRTVLFGNPERVGVTLSPDGERIGFIAPVDGVLNVWIGPADDIAAARPVTHDTGRGVRSYIFCHDDHSLLYAQDTDGNEDWRLYLVSRDGGEPRLVTPAEGVTAVILGHNRWNPQTVLIGLNEADPTLHDVYRLDLTTGETTLVESNPGYADWLIDTDLRVRGGLTMAEDGSTTVLLRDPATGEDAPWRHFPVEDAAGSGVEGFERSGQTVHLISSVDANTTRLISVDLETGTERVLAEDPVYDIGGVLTHPETREPQSVVILADRKRWVHLDAELGAEIDALAARVEGELGISRAERAGRRWLVTDALSDGPVRFYLYERSTGALDYLFSHQPALEEYTLAPMESFRLTARDGLQLEGYVTFPPNAPRQGLPAVLNVHGGPWARDAWGYDPEAQWLANRGYVCLQVNFRGSTGYGKAFGNAGNKQWGAAMHDDLVDTVRFAVEQGWVDADRVGIYGGSYGGYAALAGAAFTPEVFRCAVDLVGPSNLLTLLDSLPEYWKPLLAVFHTRVGHPEHDRDLLWERSPLSRVDNISIPLLVAQGANDPRVKVAESEQIVAALTEKDIPHEYLLFPDEGHGFARPENRERFYAAAEAFLAEHLGGRSQG